MMCGGFGNIQQPSAEAIALANKHRNEIQQGLGTVFPQWTPVGMKTQVVAGINYDIKINAGTEYIHVRIYQPLGNAESSVSVCGRGFNAQSELKNS